MRDKHEGSDKEGRDGRASDTELSAEWWISGDDRKVTVLFTFAPRMISFSFRETAVPVVDSAWLSLAAAALLSRLLGYAEIEDNDVVLSIRTTDSSDSPGREKSALISCRPSRSGS